MSEWGHRVQCDYCDRPIVTRIRGYTPDPATTERVWCPDCAPEMSEKAGYRRLEFAQQTEQDGGLFVYLEVAESVPPHPMFMDAIRLIATGSGWRVPYLTLERMIEKGLVSSTGARLTKRAKKFVT